MKINPMASYQAYKKKADFSQGSKQAEFRLDESALRGEHADQIKISPEGTHKIGIDQLTKTVAAEISKEASPERIESLRVAVQNNTYYIPTEDLVDAIMKRLFLA